ncbi:RNase adapter RapZ [uncultured Micrococcus sp.]|uniref:RNase adapter RapZ n=1 Tax=uncultured Micrococcus sp. TaxID=114051 RepID=UPI0025EEEDC7|nr:RNase adapter RapZ [uncultured Micrococcus sp.]
MSLDPQLQPEKPPSSEVLVITGMSGAGRTTAAHALQDHGWYVVENMPPQLFITLADLVARSPEAFPRLAIVVDVRSRTYLHELRAALQQLESEGVEYRTLFLDAADDVLVRRFEAGRRPHPLQGNARLLDGIQAEREIVSELKEAADVVVDTSALNVHGLATEVTELFSEDGPVTLRLNVMSFGFKYGLPADANFVADMRFIPNPHWVPALRPHTGKETEVSDYVLSQPGVDAFLTAYLAALDPVFEGYRRENKHYATLAVGCTGGKHRSVAVAEELARRIAQRPRVTVHVEHRDMGRE